LTRDIAVILNSPTVVSIAFGAILNITMPNTATKAQLMRRAVAQSDFYPEVRPEFMS